MMNFRPTSLGTLLLASLLATTTAACTDATPEELELELAEADAIGVEPTEVDHSKADGPAAWTTTPTLHVGSRVFEYAPTGGRRSHPLWVAGRTTSPVKLDFTVTAAAGYDVRIAVLGPLRNGTRAVLGADGYASRKTTAKLTLPVKTTGEHLVVIGSYNLLRDTAYDLIARCAPGATVCGGSRVDVLASPKAGALVGTGTNRLVRSVLGQVLAARSYDVEVELWASPPAQSWNAQKVATSLASGNQANVLVPAAVKAGDDLRIVVRKAGGPVLDSGVTTRFAPVATSFARTDSILYGDLVSLEISGVTGFYEGVADLRLRSEQRGIEIAAHTARADQPGAVGMGFGAFDATFAPELFDAQGTLNPNLPRNGELLSLGTINGNGEYRRLGCFEYCNDLSGMETCTGGTRTCPAP
ncbi:MAG: hypothetical protein M3680_29700 [Myxococcota bacterium]|nr:hypothetical protein [Myxococcota bacterium]